MRPETIPPLFKAENPTMTFSASKDTKLSANYHGRDQNKVALEGQAFELRWGPQGVECRIVELRRSRPMGHAPR